MPLFVLYGFFLLKRFKVWFSVLRSKSSSNLQVNKSFLLLRISPQLENLFLFKFYSLVVGLC
jgi:hypothetical protein